MNVLFIVADDLNAWIGALGRHPDVKTPNIDALAARGTLFTHAYCSAPYCNASRMGVLTGRLPATTGVYANEPLWDAPARPAVFIETLKAAGYHTFGAGKVLHGTFDYTSATGERALQAQWREVQNRPFLWDQFHTNVTDPLPPGRPVNGLFTPEEFDKAARAYHLFDWGPLPDAAAESLPDAAVVQAVANFLSSDPPEPFFCAAGLYKPHLPWHVPRRYFDLYDTNSLTLPVVRVDDLDDVPLIPRRWVRSRPDHDLVTGGDQWRPAVHAYLAAISFCDDMIGRMVAALDASGHGGSTSVVLWGDNGFHLGEKLHWRKFVLWEEATRVPLVIVVPGGPPQLPRVHLPVSLIDLHPTVLDLCGLERDAGADGSSLLGLMNGREASRPPAVMTWGRGNHSVRTAGWRLTRYVDGTVELYDHGTDPHEWTNLAGDPRFDGVRGSLERRLPAD